uniref:PIH1D1/2/3 CS-like domain-containing protein n=1 Tax=Astatotilapia calliptera TaxID=8154 RepID=A0AAX7VCL4_ASTCA
MCSTGSTEDVLQQMSKLWSMLDDLSENDPAAYRTLIEKQIKEGAEFRAPPELDSCLCTEILKPKKGLLYINICGWKRVPAPAEKIKKDLIHVISAASVEPQKPEYRLEVKTDAAGVPDSVELTVELPMVCSMSECQLSMSKDDVLLEVEDLYYLLVDFPKTVNEDTASAIFNKKKRRLTLKVNVL